MNQITLIPERWTLTNKLFSPIKSARKRQETIPECKTSLGYKRYLQNFNIKRHIKYFAMFVFNPLHLHKVVKHTQTIRWLLLAICLSVFDYFVGLALKGLKPLVFWFFTILLYYEQLFLL